MKAVWMAESLAEMTVEKRAVLRDSHWAGKTVAMMVVR